ncbi:unnamed protein product [Ixodes pacificus]
MAQVFGRILRGGVRAVVASQHQEAEELQLDLVEEEHQELRRQYGDQAGELAEFWAGKSNFPPPPSAVTMQDFLHRQVSRKRARALCQPSAWARVPPPGQWLCRGPRDISLVRCQGCSTLEVPAPLSKVRWWAARLARNLLRWHRAACPLDQ